MGEDNLMGLLRIPNGMKLTKYAYWEFVEKKHKTSSQVTAEIGNMSSVKKFQNGIKF